MKKLKFLLIIACITICSCSAYKSMNMSDIHIGMNEQEVINAMGRTPDNVIGAKKYKEGTFEILQYSKRLTLDTKIAVVY